MAPLSIKVPWLDGATVTQKALALLLLIKKLGTRKEKENSAFRYGGTRVRVRQQGKGPYTP